MNYFSIIGFQRSGSTFLYELLNSHPEIQMNTPRNPEPKYFLNQDLDKETYFKTFFPNIEQNVKWIGDKSTSYFEKREYLERMRTMFPKGKAIVILRHPVQRAISNYKFSVQNGLENRTPEEVFLLNKPKPILSKKFSTDPFDYIRRSNYINNCQLINDIFRNDVLYLILENFQINKNKELIKISKFLDIKNDFKITLSNTNSSEIIINISQEVIDNISSILKKDVEYYNSII